MAGLLFLYFHSAGFRPARRASLLSAGGFPAPADISGAVFAPKGAVRRMPASVFGAAFDGKSADSWIEIKDFRLADPKEKGRDSLCL